MGAISSLIENEATRRKVVDAGVKVIDAEVSDKRGLSGMAVKAAYKTVKKIKPGFIAMALNLLLPAFAKEMDPFYDEWKASGQGSLKDFMVKHDQRIANALLTITDRHVEHNDKRVVKKAYKSLRPQGVTHTAAAMPRLAGLITSHLD